MAPGVTKDTKNSNKQVTTPVKTNHSLKEKYLQFKKNSPSLAKRLTKVKICKIRDDENKLVAATVHNFYGAKEYLDNELPLAQHVFYYDNVQRYISAKHIANEEDCAYLLNNVKIPTNLMSIFPSPENDAVVEDIEIILKNFIDAFPIDPVNDCPIKFEYDEDFILDTDSKMEAFFFLTTKMSLPKRLQNNN